MAQWKFSEQRASDVEQELTQRDQFNNDDVGLAEALVREVIQNSSDAARSGQAVKVRFQLKELAGNEAVALRSLLDGLKPHLQASGTDLSAMARPTARVLVIEDFNTRGLTGRFDVLDEDNFRNFWRRHGRSGKGGRAGGRWGLGKLVFSSSSEVRTFFGLTLRENDAGPLLMGQAVLTNHAVEGKRYKPHGFWFAEWSEGDDPLQLPVRDADEIDSFRHLTGISRAGQTGLSIAIPYISPGIDEKAIISGVVSNYYFPILSGRLVVEVGSRIIDSRSFHEIAAETTRGTGKPIPFGFVEEVSARLSGEPDLVALKPIGPSGLDETLFDKEQLEKARQRFSSGGLLHARVPVTLKPKSGQDVRSYIDLYLKPLPEGGRPFALIARGAITLPGEERYFQGSPAYGALVANDDDMAAFLGDAENPAHTAWNTNAEKLSAAWRSPAATLGLIRHSLRHFHDLVAEQQDVRDNNALIDFFSLAELGQSAQGKKKRTPRKPPEIGPREKAISIRPRRGGFEVVAGPAAAKWTYPRIVRVRMAYDMIGANPFKRHSRFDFDLMKDEIEFEVNGAEVEAVNHYTLKMKVIDKDFSLEAKGFDEKRDIVVDARAVP